MARGVALRLAFAIGGVALWYSACLCMPLPACADSGPALTTLNQRLADIATTGDPGNRAGSTLAARSPIAASPPRKSGTPFRIFPGLVDRFNKVERLMHLKSADGNFDANLWGAFAGGRGMSIRYHVIVR